MLYQKYKSLFNKYEVNTSMRIAHFMAQIEHESNLKPISENLNYSKDRLLIVFPKYFTPNNVDPFHRNPQKIANRVYANRMGNKNETSGDGWKYRGRGFIQLTGFNNYKALSEESKIDYVNNPDLLLNETDALIAALWFWSNNQLNKLADKDDLLMITKRINGGTNGINDRKDKLLKWKNLLKV